MAGSCEQTGPSGSIKSGEILDQLSDYQLATELVSVAVKVITVAH